MQPIYKGAGKDKHSPVSYRGIFLLNTLTKLFVGMRLIEALLSKFSELNHTFTPSQQGSRITWQTNDVILPSAYPSVHREQLGLTLKKHKITGKIWHLLKENSGSVRVRVLHALVDQKEEVENLRSLPEGSCLSPTL